MAGGRIVASGTPAGLTARQGGETVVTFELPPGTGSPPPGIPGRMSRQAGSWALATGELTASLHALTGWALRENVALESLAIARRSLEDVYLELTAVEPEER
jgi:ABC-2 type transport system ATP-binding protein